MVDHRVLYTTLYRGYDGLECQEIQKIMHTLNPDTQTGPVEAFNAQLTADQELLAILFSCNNLATFESAQFYLYKLDFITKTGCKSNISIVLTTILLITTTITRPEEYPATVIN